MKTDYKSLYDQLPMAILISDPLTGRILDCNSAVEKLFERPKHETLGLYQHNLYSRGNAKKSRDKFKNFVKEGNPADYKLEVSTKERACIPIMVTNSLVTMNDKNVVMQVLNEVSIEEQSNYSLGKEQEQELVLRIFDVMAEGLLLIGPDGQIIRANSAAQDILGLKRHEVEGRSHMSPEWEIVLPDGTPLSLEEMIGFKVMQEKSLIKDVVMGIKRPVGDISWISVSATPFVDKVGKFEGVVVTFVGITEQKKMEDALRESEKMFKEMFDNVNDEIIILDTSGRIVNVNQRSFDLTGHLPDEIIGLTIDEVGIFEEEELVTLHDLIVDSLVHGTAMWSLVELEAKHKDGYKVPLEMSSRPIMSNDGGLEGYLSLLRNISERKQAEEELARVKKEKDAQLIQSTKLASLGEMATGIAHEINQPLNVIKMTATGLLGFMRKGKRIDPEMLKEELEKTDHQIERMRVIIDHLRSFARESSDVHSELLAINTPLEGCFTLMGQQLRLRDIDVQMELEEVPMIVADSNKLEQVFLNVINNARDAMCELPQTSETDHSRILKVRSFVENGNAVVTFSDTGGGIPKEHQDRIFEPFFTTKEVGKGTGLGLSISYNIIKELNGNLDFSVEEGVGTTFRVALPIAQAPSEEVAIL